MGQKNRFSTEEQSVKAEESPKAPVATQEPEKVAFLTWFVAALDKHKELKAHHMTALRTYFNSHGLKEHETHDRFAEVLARYGIK